MNQGVSSRKRWLSIVIAACGVLIVGIQFVPVDRTNPPVKAEPTWDSPETRRLAVRACFDCHSNETRWPWYSRVAPVSWLVADHVREGREEFNLSEWPGGELEEAAELVEKRKMPLWNYTLAHPEARLSDAEREALVKGFLAMDEIDRSGGSSGDTIPNS